MLLLRCRYLNVKKKPIDIKMDETADKIERESKLRYKKYASIPVSQRSQLEKESNYLEKWHGVSAKKIEYVCMD